MKKEEGRMKKAIPGKTCPVSSFFILHSSFPLK